MCRVTLSRRLEALERIAAEHGGRCLMAHFKSGDTARLPIGAIIQSLKGETDIIHVDDAPGNGHLADLFNDLLANEVKNEQG